MRDPAKTKRSARPRGLPRSGNGAGEPPSNGATASPDLAQFAAHHGARLLAGTPAQSRREGKALREEVARFRLDIDQRLRNLARQRLRSERIVEALPVAIAYLGRDLVCTWVNEAFVRMAQRPRHHLIGQSLQAVFPEAPPKLGQSLKNLFRTKKTDTPLQLPFVHVVPGKSSPRHWDVLALPVLGEDAQIEGIVLAIEVTTRVESEQAQAVRIAKLTELDRLKGDFISMVSHELRTPLSAIAGYAEFLEEETNGALTPAQRGYVQAIQTAEARIRGIVDDLLDFARIEAGTFQVEVRPVDLLEVVGHALLLLLPAGQAGRVSTSLGENPPALQVMADPSRLLQVLLNVMGNAIKFTPPGGAVSVSVERHGEDAWVAVHDTGIGIPTAALPHVFDRFYQVDSSSTRARGGVGLGLAIARSQIERQGGQMGVDSEIGRGTTPWFTLPLQPPAGD
ncbi:MAG: ATP-binding protein [Candidatus Sericytochromatia bacterium]|nr:ATP-binding protein [Candidatus Sericytochromatia bacterium]